METIETKENKKKYQLYLLPLNEENIRLAVGQRFNRMNSRYILVYSENLCDMVENRRYHIINESETGHLSDSEKVWLLEANMKIIAEETERQKEEIIKRFEERLSILEKELDAEAERLKQEKEEDGAEDDK